MHVYFHFIFLFVFETVSENIKLISKNFKVKKIFQGYISNILTEFFPEGCRLIISAYHLLSPCCIVTMVISLTMIFLIH